MDKARATNDVNHFTVAEKGYRVPIKAKEIFTLGSLAQLYCDAGTRLDEALALARRNLEYKKDREATDTLACVDDKIKRKRITASLKR